MRIKEIITELEAAISNYAAVKQWKKETNGKVLGWLPPDVPEEIIAAFGILPVAILGSQAKIMYASNHLPDYICSYIRSSFDLILRNELEFLDGIIVPHTCDTQEHLTDLIERNSRLNFTHNLLLPIQLDRPSAKKYFYQELKKLLTRLELFSGTKPARETYLSVINEYNENRQLLREILTIQREKKVLANEDFFTIVKSSMLMPKRQNNKLLILLVKELRNAKRCNDKIPVIISGSIGGSKELLNAFDAAGLAVVGDDLSNGYRYYNLDLSLDGLKENDHENVDDIIIDEFSKRYFNQIPYSGYLSDRLDKKDFLTMLVQQTGARGVIFTHLVFCEQENYDYPEIKKHLDSLAIPNILIEFELQIKSTGQLITRVEAFAETLGGN